MTIKFIRVKSRATGHEFDIRSESFDADRYTKVDPKRYPETSRPRRPKPNVPKGGRSKKPAPVDTDKE